MFKMQNFDLQVNLLFGGIFLLVRFVVVPVFIEKKYLVYSLWKIENGRENIYFHEP